MTDTITTHKAEKDARNDDITTYADSRLGPVTTQLRSLYEALIAGEVA